MSTRNREAGHKYERDIVKALVAIGFPHVVTSRSESRSRDNVKIDLCNKDEYKNGRLRCNIQCKSLTDHPTDTKKVEKVKYRELLKEIEVMEGIMNVVLHRHTVRRGSRFVNAGEYAFMYQADFLSLLEESEKYRKLRQEILDSDSPLKSLL